MSTVHIVGAGLSGLAAAVALAGGRRRVALYEAAPHAGGRCRSFFEPGLGRRIDNGNHLLLSANRAALAYLSRIGARETLIAPQEAAFPFVDLASGQRWVLRPNHGPLPWWLLVPSRRIPNTHVGEYLSSGWRLMTGGPEATVADRIAPTHPLYRRFWEPLTLAALNADPALAAVGPLKTVLLETFGRGARYCRPLIARDGLGDSLVEPALAFLADAGIRPAFGRRLRRLVFEGERGGRVTALDFGGGGGNGGGGGDGGNTGVVPLAADDAVVLALPAGITAELLPGLNLPDDGHVIVNAHFRLDRPPPPLPAGQPFIGVINGTAHWVFVRGDLASVTVSGAGLLAEQPAASLADLLWHDTARALGLPESPTPPARIIKEKRATFVQTPQNQRRRPPTRTLWPNLCLAGDWTATGLPATIEGAIRSGFKAAKAVA